MKLTKVRPRRFRAHFYFVEDKDFVWDVTDDPVEAADMASRAVEDERGPVDVYKVQITSVAEGTFRTVEDFYATGNRRGRRR